MTFDESIKRIFKELRPVKSERLVLKMYFMMMYSIGFDAGIRVKSHQKTVLKMDKYGYILEEYESAVQAARKNNAFATNITKVCRGIKNTHKGFHWRYKNI